MKHRHINKDKIIEVFYSEPYEPDAEMPFGEKHGWRVILIVGYEDNGYAIRIIIDKESEKDCVDFINNLNLTPLF